jgi:signal transduction histidine kinase
VKSRLVTSAAVIAVASAAASLALVLASNHEADPGARGALIVGLGLIFVACGLIAIVRRPENRTGMLMVIVGFFWFLSSLSEANNPTIFTLGLAVNVLIYASFAHVVLAYPTGKVETPLARTVVVLAYLDVTVVQWLLLLFRSDIGNTNLPCDDCPRNVFLVSHSHAAGTAVDNVQRGVGVALAWAALMILYRRFRASTPAGRRTLLPVYITASVAIALVAVQLIATSIDRDTAGTINWFVLASFATVPLGFLLGLLQSRLARSGILRMVADTPDELTLRDAEQGLREALGDPTLRLAYWLDDETGYVNVRGKPFDIPPDTPKRVTTQIDYEEGRLAALWHDRALLTEPNLLEEVIGVVRMGLVKDRGARALRASEIRTRALLDAFPDLMFRIGIDGRYLDYRAPSDYDLVQPEVVGKTVWDRLPEDLAEQFMQAGRKAIETQQVQELEYDLAFGDETRHFEGRIAASGEDEFVLIVRNMTERYLHERELQASRQRIVAAGDEERRRLERNLHDGAQQRLVSLSLSLRLAESQMRRDPESAANILTGARDELAQALEELRELARGIHPAILTDKGLNAALDALASRAPIPVEIQTGSSSLPPPVEAAAYYVVSEALANIAKYAEATSVQVSVAQQNGSAHVVVADDGVGGADPTSGSGLRGLADRIGALDGTLHVESAPGAGTTITAVIPLSQN